MKWAVLAAGAVAVYVAVLVYAMGKAVYVGDLPWNEEDLDDLMDDSTCDKHVE